MLQSKIWLRKNKKRLSKSLSPEVMEPVSRTTAVATGKNETHGRSFWEVE